MILAVSGMLPRILFSRSFSNAFCISSVIESMKRFSSNGLRLYHDAWLKEFRTNKLLDSTVHIRQITLAGQHNNNKMERLNGEIGDRERLTRNPKREDTPILTGM